MTNNYPLLATSTWDNKELQAMHSVIDKDMFTMGKLHRLETEVKIPAVLIKAQVGEYIREDDIVRIDDDFKRGYA